MREGAAIALAELQSRDETTKHSLCSAIASAPLSVSAEAASVLERLLFPTDRWSDGLDGIDLELLGTLSLLCESGLGPDARSWTCSRSLEHLGLVPSRGEVLPPELTKACASQGLVYAAGTLIGSLGDVGVTLPTAILSSFGIWDAGMAFEICGFHRGHAFFLAEC